MPSFISLAAYATLWGYRPSMELIEEWLLRGECETKPSARASRLEEVAAMEDRLFAVALQAFVAHGYGGTSMRTIVNAAQISKTTLYSRFPSKERLFRAIMRQQIDRLSVATSLRSNDGPLGLEEGLKSYADRTLDISLKGELLEVNRLIYSEAPRFPELGVAAAERTQEGIRQVADFIRERAAVDGIPCADPEGIAEVFILMLRGWYVNVMLTKGEVPAAKRKAWIDRAVRVLVSSRREWGQS